MTAPVRFEAFDRRSGIGASEWSALVGASPWSTPAQLWLEKSGLATSRESDLMRTGRELETTVLRMASRQLDRRLTHNGMTFRHPDWPAVPLFATPDAFGPGRAELAEAKVVAHRMDDWKGGPPVHVDFQVQAQLACLPRVGSGLVVALIGGEVKTWRIDRDPDVQAMLPDLVATWWKDHVLGDRAPDPVTQDDRWALLRSRIRTDVRQERIATPDEQRIGSELRGLLQTRASLDQAIETARLELAMAAKDSDVAGLGWRASWTDRSTVDWRQLASDLAIAQDDIDSHTRTTTSFAFRQGRE